MTTNKTVATLLHELSELRMKDKYAQEFPQRIHPPDHGNSGIPTLEPSVNRKLSPMLRARFNFAGDWENAFIGSTWLGIPSMKSYLRKRSVRKQIAVRGTYWEGSVVARYHPQRIGLFSIDLDDGSETYLVWPRKDSVEPRLVWYVAQQEHRFKNLKEYVQSFIKLR